jgi:hypothetical protein
VDAAGHGRPEAGLDLGQGDAVLRAARPGQRRDHGPEVEVNVLVVADRRRRVVPQAHLLGVSLDQRDLARRPSGERALDDSLPWWLGTRDVEQRFGRPIDIAALPRGTASRIGRLHSHLL